VLWLRYWALPHVDQYRDTIVSSLEKASGMAVSAKAIRGGWEGLRPRVSLEGFAMADRRGKVALAFERAEVTVSWWSLLVGQVRFHDVDFYKPALALRRGADGLIYLADKPMNTAGPDDGAFTEWLLAQPRLGIHGAVLAWRDEKSGAPEIELTDVEIAVRKEHGRHLAALTATPPRELSGRIDMRAEVFLTREGKRWQAQGDVYVEGRNADLAKLRAHLPVPETLRTGVGSLRVWARFTHEGLQEVVADLNMRDARGQFASDVLPLELASISGRARYKVERDGFSFATQGLRFRLASGLEVRPGNFFIARSEPAGALAKGEIRADGIDLKIAATLLDYFPVPRDLKAHALRYAPRGRISEAHIAWTGGGGAPVKTYALKGRFDELSVNAVDSFPGLSGLTGHIEGTEAGGIVVLASKGFTFEQQNLFRAPLAVDSLDAKATWKHVGNALEVTISDAVFANADAEGRFAGTWRSLPEAKERSPGLVDIKGTLARAVASRLANYLPNRVAATRDWLDRAVESGTGNNIAFALKGDLWHFPFGNDDAQGLFLLEGDIHGARLNYHPDWPPVDDIEGHFRFQNRSMEIRTDRAAIFASRATEVSAVVADFGAKPPVLVLKGDIDTTGADTVRFLRESPLVNGPGAFTRAVAIEGPGRLKLQLIYPLWGTDPLRVIGDYTFAGATASVAKTLAMRDVRGKLSFTERGVRAPEITGTLFGKPATLTMATQPDGQVVTQIDGKADAAAMADYVPEAIVARLAGTTDWKARVVSGKQGTELTVTSDLKGLASSLPEPLAKASADARAFTLTMSRLGAESEATTVTIAERIHGRFTRAGTPGAEHWQAAVKFGAPVSSEPVRDGLWLYGALPTLDVDAWQAVFAASRDASGAAPPPGRMELRGVDMNLGSARYWGRDFHNMRAQLERSGSQWTGKLESPLVAGEVQWSWAGKGRMVAKLERLSITEPAAGSAAAEPQQGTQSDLPALDVTAERFEFRGKWLGKLDLKAEPQGDEWRIDKLDIGNAHAQFQSTGAWRRTATGSITTLAIKLDTENLNALMGQFGFGDYMKRGTGNLGGNLVWPGYPYDFALANLAGTFKVDARGGQFAKIEPGAGKLLGLLSLQSLPRRAMFDFRDVFSDGFAFERIHGDVKVARGILLTEGFEISGPSAFVSLAGEVSLPQETQTLNMHIVPEVGEGLALAATLIGTPVLGLSTLLVSKLLKNPLGKAVAYEYQVTGSWDNPQVTRLSAPPPKTAATQDSAATVKATNP